MEELKTIRDHLEDNKLILSDLFWKCFIDEIVRKFEVFDEISNIFQMEVFGMMSLNNQIDLTCEEVMSKKDFFDLISSAQKRKDLIAFL